MFDFRGQTPGGAGTKDRTGQELPSGMDVPVAWTASVKRAQGVGSPAPFRGGRLHPSQAPSPDSLIPSSFLLQVPISHHLGDGTWHAEDDCSFIFRSNPTTELS